jgi:hypothetical protein
VATVFEISIILLRNLHSAPIPHVPPLLVVRGFHIDRYFIQFSGIGHFGRLAVTAILIQISEKRVGSSAWASGLADRPIFSRGMGLPRKTGLRALCWLECNGALAFSLSRAQLQVHEGTIKTFL